MEVVEFDGGEEVNFEGSGGGLPVVADFAGDSERARSGDSMVGEKKVALPSGDFFVIDPGFEDDVAEGYSSLNGLSPEADFHWSEGGADGDDGVAKGFGPGEAIAGGAGAGIAGASSTEDDVFGGYEFGFGADAGDFASGGDNFGNGGVKLDVDPGFIEVGVKDADDIFGGLVDREDATVGPGVDAQSTLGEHVDYLDICKSMAGRADEISFVFSKCFEDLIDGAIVGDIALSSTGDEDFCADAIGFFEEGNGNSSGGESVAGDDSGGTRADDDHRLLHMLRILLKVKFGGSLKGCSGEGGHATSRRLGLGKWVTLRSVERHTYPGWGQKALG